MGRHKKNLLVADALRDPDDPEIDVDEDPGDEDDAPDEIPPVHVAAPVTVETPALPAAGAVSLTMEQLQAIISGAVTAATAAGTQGMQSIADSVRLGIEQSRTPIHENQIHHGVSALNPLGDTLHPRPGLKCRMTRGIQDAKTKVISESYPWEADDLSGYEQIALNTLEPAHAIVNRLDGVQMKVTIVPERDPVTDALTKLTVVLPTDVMQKGSQVKNMVPDALNLVLQITGRDFSKLSNDDLAWFMAEHRAGRYVAEREPVAA